MYAPSAGVAAKRFRIWKQHWKDKIPKAVSCVEKDFDKLLPFFQFPNQLRKMIRTTRNSAYNVSTIWVKPDGNEAWAVGNSVVVLHFNGERWLEDAGATEATEGHILRDIWVRPDDAGEGWAVGYHLILRHQDNLWRKDTAASTLVVQRYIDEGLVVGETVCIDSTLIKANASMDSFVEVKEAPQTFIKRVYQENDFESDEPVVKDGTVCRHYDGKTNTAKMGRRRRLSEGSARHDRD